MAESTTIDYQSSIKHFTMDFNKTINTKYAINLFLFKIYVSMK